MLIIIELVGNMVPNLITFLPLGFVYLQSGDRVVIVVFFYNLCITASSIT